MQASNFLLKQFLDDVMMGVCVVVIDSSCVFSHLFFIKSERNAPEWSNVPVHVIIIDPQLVRGVEHLGLSVHLSVSMYLDIVACQKARVSSLSGSLVYAFGIGSTSMSVSSLVM